MSTFRVPETRCGLKSNIDLLEKTTKEIRNIPREFFPDVQVMVPSHQFLLNDIQALKFPVGSGVAIILRNVLSSSRGQEIASSSRENRPIGGIWVKATTHCSVEGNLREEKE